MQRIFHRRKKINSNFSHIFIARHIVNLQEWIAHSRSVVHTCMATFLFWWSCAPYFPRIIENSSHHRHTYLPPDHSRQFWSSLQLLCLSLKTSRKKTKTLFFYDFWSGLERCLEASASLLIGILTVNFRLSIDHRRFRDSPLSGPKRTIEVVKMFCFSLYINCYY